MGHFTAVWGLLVLQWDESSFKGVFLTQNHQNYPQCYIQSDETHSLCEAGLEFDCKSCLMTP